MAAAAAAARGGLPPDGDEAACPPEEEHWPEWLVAELRNVFDSSLPCDIMKYPSATT